MELREQTTLTILEKALPESFPFYHLGDVKSRGPAERTGELEDLFEKAAAIRFRLDGDVSGSIIILFDRDLDFATYTEMGNIIASQLANRITAHQGLDMMISAPERLSEAQVSFAVRHQKRAIRKTYLHRHAGIEVLVQVLVLPLHVKEAGYA